ncbi:MAG: serine/threonine-protein kinase [Thermosynechococcaceae cyanobacterium]
MIHKPGNVLNNQYVIVKLLGKGSSGHVYEAINLKNNLRVAIKFLSIHEADNWKEIELFQREAKVLSKLSHPSIPKYVDYFTIDSLSDYYFCLVQDLVKGTSAEQILSTGSRFDEDEAIEIIGKLLDTLDYLHNQEPPVIHRDIKPGNIIICNDKSIFLVDFGSVRIETKFLSEGSTFVGTYGFIAPEQFLGQSSIVSDLYSVGATALSLLANMSPSEFPHRSFKVLFRQFIDVSNEFAAWLDILLEPMPERRFQSAKQALAGLYNPEVVNNFRNDLCTKPNGSKISFDIKADNILVIMPSNNRRKTDILAVVPALALLSFAYFVLFGDLGMQDVSSGYREILVRCFCSLPAAWVGLIVILRTFFGAFGFTSLNIKKDDFQLKWSLFFLSDSVSGKTPNISEIALSYEADSRKAEIGPPNSSRCVISDGDLKHYFGLFLSEQERKWLVREISTYLNIDNEI